MSILRIKELEAQLERRDERIDELEEAVRKLQFMVENGLGYEDLERDI
jgi:hypothetical protein